MAILRATAAALALFLTGLPALPAAERTLLVLASTTDADVAFEVLDETGGELAESPQAASIWRLEPGDSVEDDRRPPGRLVDLYTGTARSLNLVARIAVRYFPTASGWTPYFRLDEQPVVARIDGRWQALVLPGAAGFLVRYGSTLPNPEGFFPTLEFGPSTGVLAIVGWQVH